MTYTTAYDLGTIPSLPTEAGVIIRPKIAPASPQPGVMFVHGAGSDATYCIAPTGRQSELTRKVAMGGFVGLSHDNGPIGSTDTWGNDTAISRLASGRTALQALPGVRSGQVATVSASMGGANALAWAAANPAHVSCIVSVIPVIDITDIHDTPREGGLYTYSINTAYAGGWTEATYGVAHNPLTLARNGKLAGIPMLIFYGLTDTLCVKEKTEEFASLPGMNVELVPLPTGHDFDTYNAVDHDRIVAFLREHA